ncbi:MAG TPA: MbtH family NRPS accessory protein [Actinomycetes bacterium]|nr:MbtH family NRPS accessory protein [Actinomycetes bacterium]
MFYLVIINDDGCYAIWPRDTSLPPEWKPTGFSGTAEVALNQVAELWRSKVLRPRDTRGGPDDSEQTRRPNS